MAVHDLYITNATNGIKFTQLERQRLKSIRYQPADQPTREGVAQADTEGGGLVQGERPHEWPQHGRWRWRLLGRQGDRPPVAELVPGPLGGDGPDRHP